MAEFQKFLQFFKSNLVLKCTSLINAEFNNFESLYIQYMNNNSHNDSSDSDSDNDKRQNLSSTSDSDHNENERESSPERD